MRMPNESDVCAPTRSLAHRRSPVEIVDLIAKYGVSDAEVIGYLKSLAQEASFKPMDVAKVHLTL